MTQNKYIPCTVCNSETGLAPNESCKHTCRACEGTRMELDGFPCIECGGTGLKNEYQEKNYVYSPKRWAREGRLLNLRFTKRIMGESGLTKAEQAELRALEGIEPDCRDAHEALGQRRN